MLWGFVSWWSCIGTVVLKVSAGPVGGSAHCPALPTVALLCVPRVTSDSHSCKTDGAVIDSLPDAAPIINLVCLKKLEFLFL